MRQIWWIGIRTSVFLPVRNWHFKAAFVSILEKTNRTSNLSLNLFDSFVRPQKQRGKILKDFTEWLKNCHEKWDKQVKFERFKETIERKELTPKKMQHPWATFSSIQWDGKEYRTGQLVSVYSFIYFLFFFFRVHIPAVALMPARASSRRWSLRRRCPSCTVAWAGFCCTGNTRAASSPRGERWKCFW